MEESIGYVHANVDGRRDESRKLYMCHGVEVKSKAIQGVWRGVGYGCL